MMCPKESPVKSPGQLDGYWQPVDDWTQLQDRFVEIHRRGTILDRGLVDAVTIDGSILWLAHDGAATRRLILKQDAVNVKLLLARETSG
ncbi:hypothetical protein M1D93_17380 [Arthrobacter sp. Z1-9]